MSAAQRHALVPRFPHREVGGNVGRQIAADREKVLRAPRSNGVRCTAVDVGSSLRHSKTG
eukprot:13627898-Alexandrium_andersonii.AAC.1